MAVANMQTSFARVPDQGEGRMYRPSGGDQWVYYRRPDGWITSGQIGKGRRIMHSYINQGWTPLEKYGTFDLKPYYADRPFEVLFQAGGAKELPVEQILENAMHLNPPVIPGCGSATGPDHLARYGSLMHNGDCMGMKTVVEFPQLQGVDLPEPVECPHCTDRVFVSEKVFQRHLRVMHKEEVGNTELGKALAGGMESSFANLLAKLMTDAQSARADEPAAAVSAPKNTRS